MNCYSWLGLLTGMNNALEATRVLSSSKDPDEEEEGGCIPQGVAPKVLREDEEEGDENMVYFPLKLIQ